MTFILNATRPPRNATGMFGEMATVAPARISAATDTLGKASRRWPVAGPIPPAIRDSRPYRAVGRFLARHCPVDSPLAMRTLVFSASASSQNER